MSCLAQALNDAVRCPGRKPSESKRINALLVPPRNHGALAATIEKLALDAPLRARLGAAGRDIVVKEYAESIVVRETLDLYRHLCSAGAAS